MNLTVTSSINKPNQLAATKGDQFWLGLKEGNQEALSKLFCKYYTLLFRYGYKIIPREDLIEDAIQELFLILWDRRETIDEARSVKSYLFCSLRRIVFRKLKKQKNRKERNRTYYIENLFGDLFNKEELMVHFETKCERREKLSDAIDGLSKRQKEAIYLKFYEGLSYKEIAYVMEINRQSAYNHISEAIRLLQNFVN